MAKSFNKWLDTFLNEKGLNLEKLVNVTEKDSEYGESIGMTYEVVVEIIKNSSEENQRKIKDTLVKIDFRSGDVKDVQNYLDFLANAFIKARNESR